MQSGELPQSRNLRRREYTDKIKSNKAQYYLENKEKILEYKKDYYSKNNGTDSVWRTRLRKLGLTEDDYIRMFNEQNGCCAICRAPETAILRGKIKRLSTDHDYETGRVRQLLCSRCNTMIGLALEDTNILQSAIQYLEKWGVE